MAVPVPMTLLQVQYIKQGDSVYKVLVPKAIEDLDDPDIIVEEDFRSVNPIICQVQNAKQFQMDCSQDQSEKPIITSFIDLSSRFNAVKSMVKLKVKQDSQGKKQVLPDTRRRKPSVRSEILDDDVVELDKNDVVGLGVLNQDNSVPHDVSENSSDIMVISPTIRQNPKQGLASGVGKLPTPPSKDQNVPPLNPLTQSMTSVSQHETPNDVMEIHSAVVKKGISGDRCPIPVLNNKEGMVLNPQRRMPAKLEVKTAAPQKQAASKLLSPGPSLVNTSNISNPKKSQPEVKPTKTTTSAQRDFGGWLSILSKSYPDVSQTAVVQSVVTACSKLPGLTPLNSDLYLNGGSHKNVVLNSNMAKVQPEDALNSFPINISASKNLPDSVHPCSKNLISGNDLYSTDQCMKEQGNVICDSLESNETSMFTIGPAWSLAEEQEAISNIPVPPPSVNRETKVIVSTNVSQSKPPSQFLCPGKPISFLNIQVSSPDINPETKAIFSSTNNVSKTKPPSQLLSPEKSNNLLNISSSLLKETLCTISSGQGSLNSYSVFNNVNPQTVFKVQDIGNSLPTVSSKLKLISNENKTLATVQTKSDTAIIKQSSTIASQSSHSNTPESAVTSVNRKTVHCTNVFPQIGRNIADNNSKTYSRETMRKPIDVAHHSQDANIKIPFNKSTSTTSKLGKQQQITIASQDEVKIATQFLTNSVNKCPKSPPRPKIAIVAPLPSEKKIYSFHKNSQEEAKTFQNAPWNKINTYTVEKPSINIVDKIAQILNENYEDEPSRITEQKMPVQTSKMEKYENITNSPGLFRVSCKNNSEGLPTSSLRKNTLQTTIASLESSFAKTSVSNVVSNKFPLPLNKGNINASHTRLKNVSNNPSRYHAIEDSLVKPDIQLEPSCSENNIFETTVQETSEPSHDPEFASDEITRTPQIIISNICSVKIFGDKSTRTSAALFSQKTKDPSNSNDVPSQKSLTNMHNLENNKKPNFLSDRVNRNEKRVGELNMSPSACGKKHELNSCADTSGIDSLGKLNFGKKSNALPDRVCSNPFPNWNPDPVSSWDPQYVINVKTERESDENPDNSSTTTSSESESSSSSSESDSSPTDDVCKKIDKTPAHLNCSPSSTDDECKKVEMKLTMARLKSKSERKFTRRNRHYNNTTPFSESNDDPFQSGALKSTVKTRSQKQTETALISPDSKEHNEILLEKESCLTNTPSCSSDKASGPSSILFRPQFANASVPPQSKASILYQPKKSNVNLLQPHLIKEYSESLSSESLSSVSETSLSESETERYIQKKHAKCRFQHNFSHEKAKEVTPVPESPLLPLSQPQNQNASMLTSPEQKTRDVMPYYLKEFKIPKVQLKSYNTTCAQNASRGFEMDRTRTNPESTNHVVETQSQSSSLVFPKTDIKKPDCIKFVSPYTLSNERIPTPKLVIQSTHAGIKIDKPTSEQHVSPAGQAIPFPVSKQTKKPKLDRLLSESLEFLSNNKKTKTNLATRTSYNSCSLSGQIISLTVCKRSCSEPKSSFNQITSQEKLPKRLEIKPNPEPKLVFHRSDSYMSMPVQTSNHSVHTKMSPVGKTVRKNTYAWSLLQVVKPCFVRLEKFDPSMISSPEFRSPPKLSVVSPLRSTKPNKKRKRKRKSAISRPKLVKQARFENPEIASPTGKCIVFSPESSSNEDNGRVTEKSLSLEKETVPMFMEYCVSNRMDTERHQDSGTKFDQKQVQVKTGSSGNIKLQGGSPGSNDSRERTEPKDDADLASKHARVVKLLDEKTKLLATYRRKFGGL